MTHNALSKTYISFAISLTTGCMFSSGKDSGGSNDSNGDAFGYGSSTGSTTFNDDDEPGDSTGEPARDTSGDSTSTGSAPSADEDPGPYAMFESFTIDVNQTCWFRRVSSVRLAVRSPCGSWRVSSSFMKKGG